MTGHLGEGCVAAEASTVCLHPQLFLLQLVFRSVGPTPVCPARTRRLVNEEIVVGELMPTVI